MGISLAPQPVEEKPDDLLPPKPKPVAAPTPTAPVGLAPAPAQQAAPKMASAPAAAPQAAIPPSAYGNASTVPAPTVAAPTAPINRVQLATDTFDKLAEQRNAKYQADSRDNIRNSAALGQVASGGLRTREGNLQLARERDLDTLQRDLSLKAAEASAADASTAFQQALAGSQQGLAERLGLAGIDQQKNALALQERLGLGGLNAEQQRIAIAQKQQDIDTAYNAGRMTLAERDAARADLALAQQNLQQTASLGLERERLEIARGAQDIANRVALGQLSIAQAQQQLDERVRSGQLTLAERNQALAELSQQQNQGNEQQRLQLQRDQLAQQGEQFGLSLAQQKELATLADATQNRQIDVSSAQGRNALVLELARIMGTPTMSLDPRFIESIARALGVTVPGPTNPTTTNNNPANPTGSTSTTTGVRPDDDRSRGTV